MKFTRQYAFIAGGGGPRGIGFFVRPPDHAVVTSEDDMLWSQLHVRRPHMFMPSLFFWVYFIWTYCNLQNQSLSSVIGFKVQWWKWEKELMRYHEECVWMKDHLSCCRFTAAPMNTQWHNTGNMEFREQLQRSNLFQGWVLGVVIVYWLLGNNLMKRKYL